MKQSICLLLVLLLCLPFAASCKGKTPPETGNGTTAGSTPDTAPDSEPGTEVETDEYGREVLKSALPEDLKYDNEKITVMVRSCQEQWFIGTDDKKATAVSQSLYSRDRLVEDRLQVILKIQSVTQTGSDTTGYDQTIRSVLAGSGTYDIITSYAYFTPTLAVAGCFADLNNVKNLHMDTICWNRDFADSVAFDGALYFNVGDFSLDYIGTILCVFVNKNLARRHFGSDQILYDMVEDGSWTMGNVGTLIRDVYDDLNENGNRDINDFYGFSMNALSGPCEGVVTGIGFNYVDRSDSGEYQIFRMDNALSDRIDALHTFLGQESVAPRNTWGWGPSTKAFAQEKSILLSSCLNIATNFVEADFDYGFLPAFKYDEEQKKYHTGVGDAFSLQALMRNGTDNERAGAVLQCLNEVSYQKTTPEYFNVLLKGRYADAPEDMQMLELLRQTIQLDFGRIYSSCLSRITGGVWNNFCNPAANYSKWYEENSGTWEQNLKDLLEELRKGKTA